MGNELNAEGLADEFKADTTAANTKYAGGDLTISGTVVFAGESHGGDPMVILARFSGGISVLFKKDHGPKVKELATGALVTVSGHCRKKGPVESNVIIENAVLGSPSAGAVVEQIRDIAGIGEEVETTLVSKTPPEKKAAKKATKKKSSVKKPVKKSKK